MVKARANWVSVQSARSGAETSPYSVPAYEAGIDADGEHAMVPRRKLTLVEQLMVRSGSMAAPAPAPVKRGRGRPRKVVEA